MCLALPPGSRMAIKSSWMRIEERWSSKDRLETSL
jgi:hypothetical protein